MNSLETRLLGRPFILPILRDVGGPVVSQWIEEGKSSYQTSLQAHQTAGNDANSFLSDESYIGSFVLTRYARHLKEKAKSLEQSGQDRPS